MSKATYLNPQIANLALEEVRNGLKHQQEFLKHLRAQGLVLASVSALIAQLMYSLNEPDPAVVIVNAFGGLSLAHFLAFLCMTISVAAAILVVLPQRDWKFFVSANTILFEIPSEEELSLQEVVPLVCKLHENALIENESRLSKLASRVLASVCFTMAQVPLWMIG